MFLKVIACEIAFREICHLAADAEHLLDLEFLTQGYHDTPATGRTELQKRIDAVPVGKYDAIVVGYGLCSNILAGIRATHTRLVVPRAHDCITFFLGSKERYQEMFQSRPGTYYYTSGWLECAKRRGLGTILWGPLPFSSGMDATYQDWVRKYGEDQARYLLEEMSRWTTHYTHGVLIDFEFTKQLKLDDQVKQICTEKGWEFDHLAGDLGLLKRLLNGQWDSREVQIIEPGQSIVPTQNDLIIDAR